MNITYVPKEEIYPMLGCYSSVGGIKIREDLPKCVQDFLLDHEFAHEDDLRDQEGFFEKELESNWAGFCRHPIGGFIAIIMSLAPYRLIYYLKRLKEKK